MKRVLGVEFVPLLTANHLRFVFPENSITFVSSTIKRTTRCCKTHPTTAARGLNLTWITKKCTTRKKQSKTVLRTAFVQVYNLDAKQSAVLNLFVVLGTSCKLTPSGVLLKLVIGNYNSSL